MEKLWASFKFEPSIYQSCFHCFVIEKIVNRFLENWPNIQVVLKRIHRHIGGLEIELISDKEWSVIHRHIGGLEILSLFYRSPIWIHRHIGGLESWVAPV